MATAEQLAGKFMSCAAGALSAPRARDALAALQALDDVPALRPIIGLCVGSNEAPPRAGM